MSRVWRVIDTAHRDLVDMGVADEDFTALPSGARSVLDMQVRVLANNEHNREHYADADCPDGIPWTTTHIIVCGRAVRIRMFPALMWPRVPRRVAH